MRSEHAILPGDKFGSWEVIGPASKANYYTCRCRCGTVRDVYKWNLSRGLTLSCGCISRNDAAKKASQKASENYAEKAKSKIGSTINGFKVLDVWKREMKGYSVYMCKAICPICKKETETYLNNLPKIKQCNACHKNNAVFLEDMRNEFLVSGSSLAAVKTVTNGRVWSNSTTGVNGVSYGRRGGYRAYITFKGKQYSLGTYKDIENAKAARKAAEDVIFREFLEENQGWESEIKEIVSEYKTKDLKERQRKSK